jgi:nitroreductase/NAD-dependent dihydropyrimidine dehydrogenase PreA subunit
MTPTAPTVIDEGKCTGCGLCLPVCPAQAISMEDGCAVLSGECEMLCGHCAAACPEEAVQVSGLEDDALSFKTIRVNRDWLPHGEFPLANLVQLMGSRRSCRNYQSKPVHIDRLKDLVTIGITAPSGTNSQQWTFTLLPSRREVVYLGIRILKFFERLNKLAGNPFIRTLTRVTGNRHLSDYYRDYFETVRQGLADWKEEGLDRLFHGAPAVIIVGSKPGASCPAEDALLASQNILLAAHAMGLGTCLVGFAVSAMNYDADIKKHIGIPDTESIYAVIALGYPDERYHHFAGRKKATCRIFECPASQV